MYKANCNVVLPHVRNPVFVVWIQNRFGEKFYVRNANGCIRSGLHKLRALGAAKRIYTGTALKHPFSHGQEGDNLVVLSRPKGHAC